MIIIIGLYLSIRLRFTQFNFKKMIYNLRHSNKSTTGISSLESLMIVLSGRIGVGSISGICIAIFYGGIGTIFWIWLITLISLPITFLEVILGIKYKQKDENSIYMGGPSYYIKQGIGNIKLASIYSILAIVTYIGGFLPIQSNTIYKSINTFLKINPLIIGLIIGFITYLIIRKGIKGIAKHAYRIVPFMIFLYLLSGFVIFLKNIDNVPYYLYDILKSALNLKSGLYAVIATAIIGVQKGIFSSEAVIGTVSIASSTTEDAPVSQGYIQILGIYITTFLVCTTTAIILITSNYHNYSFVDLNGIELAQYAFNYHFGSMGSVILFITICLFSFSTILSGYYIGESCAKYFYPKSNIVVACLRIVSILLIIIGCLVKSSGLWRFIDILIGVLAIINVYSIYKLKEEAIIIYKNQSKYDKL